MKRGLTFAEEGYLLDRRSILEEVQVDKGNLLAASVLDNGLDLGVVNLGQGDLEARGAGLLDRGGSGSLEHSQESNGGDELHDEG